MSNKGESSGGRRPGGHPSEKNLTTASIQASVAGGVIPSSTLEARSQTKPTIISLEGRIEELLAHIEWQTDSGFKTAVILGEVNRECKKHEDAHRNLRAEKSQWEADRDCMVREMADLKAQIANHKKLQARIDLLGENFTSVRDDVASIKSQFQEMPSKFQMQLNSFSEIFDQKYKENNLIFSAAIKDEGSTSRALIMDRDTETIEKFHLLEQGVSDLKEQVQTLVTRFQPILKSCPESNTIKLGGLAFLKGYWDTVAVLAVVVTSIWGLLS